jgi:RNA polymerase sigma-70 factor (ECF subfamily)
MDPDLSLLERWRAGDRGAGQELFRRHFAQLFRFFNSKVGTHAEDLTQQTFLECVKSRDRFRGESTFRTYIFGIAWNELRHHLRRRVSGARHVDFESSSLTELSAGDTSLSVRAEREMQARRLHHALVELPVAQQVLLEYHYWYDLDAAALGEIFAVPAGTIRVRLLRARNAIRERLEQIDAGDPVPTSEDPLTTSLVQLAAHDRAESCGD